MKHVAQFRSTLIALAVAAFAAGASALGPPPTPKDALWGGGDWGKVNISQKVINNGDTLTITATLVGGPPKQGYYCAWGNWAVTGTSGITINIPGCFQVVDYSPKADALHNVSVTSYWVVWNSIIPPSPRNDINPRCYCHDWGWGNQCWMDTCPENFWKTGMMGPGDTVSVTLKSNCTNDSDWVTTSADFSGNWGVGWGDSATDYFKIGGHETVSLTATPGTLPADGRSCALAAHVYETQSNVNLPNQAVAFSQLPTLGLINPATALTDANGVAHSSISSVRHGGTTVAASVPPSSQDHVPVIFTPTANSINNAKNNLGKKKSWSSLGDPINAALGNYVFSKQMLTFPGKGLPFGFEVTYNSLDNTYNGPLGYGWTHTYNVVLRPPVPPSNNVTIKWGDGHEDTYQGDGAGNFTPVNCTTEVGLTMPDASHYLATLYNKTTYEFDSSGWLLAITDLNGNQIGITYSSTVPGEIDYITDTAGRQIAFAYDVAGHITAITPPVGAGNGIAFQYDGAGNLTGITDARGKTWTFTYDGSHRLLAQINAKGVTVVTNAYDGSGRVAQQTDGAGNVTTYQYAVDASGTTTTVTPPSGNTVTQVYDLAYNLLSSTDGEGHQGAFATDSLGRLSGAVDKNGNAIETVYDASGNPALAQDRSGALFQFTSNAQNRPTSVTDPLNHTTSFGWDANGNLTGVWNANGEAMSITVDASGLPTAISDFRSTDYLWSFAYDSAGLPQTTTDPNGAQTGFLHDAAGRATQITLPDGGTVTTTYDMAGNLLTRTDPLGNVTSYTYDDNSDLATQTFVPTGATSSYEYDWAGRLTKTTDALGGVTRRTCDADGNVVSTVDPDGVTLTYQYDRSNRLTATVDPLGHHVYFGYDADGNVVSLRNEAGDTWTSTYDAEGRRLSATDSLGDATIVSYDAAGRAASITDALGNTVTFQYDAAGRLLSKTLPDQGIVNYVNDQNGRPMYLSDPLGHTWTFYYDGVGQMVQKTDPNGQTESYSYDGLGRVTQKTLRDGTVISYTYDTDGRLISVSMPGQTITNAYDAAGNLTGITDPTGTTTMTYDKLGRRLTRTDPNGKTVAFTYAPAGRLKTITYPGGNVVTYAYDAAGRLATITDWASNQTTFQYDSVNRVTQATLPNGTKTLFTYDAAGRTVARVHQTSGGTVLASYTYAYDAAGHITSVQRTEPATPASLDSKATYTYDPVNRVLTANVDGVATTYTFDLKGNLISKTSAAGTTTYTYDSLSRLVSVSDGTNTTTYTYDGAGNRLAKTFNGTKTQYVREGGTVYCTLDGTGNVQTYNICAGSLLYTLDSSGAMSVYHGDDRGSVAAITDASQNVVQSYSYDPYGKVLGATGSLANAFQYVGTRGVMADEDGLYHMQARYYDPDARRFITEDPLGLSAGLNLFGYGGGDPVNHTDPTGTQSIDVTSPENLAGFNVVDWLDAPLSNGQYPIFSSQEEVYRWANAMKYKYAGQIEANRCASAYEALYPQNEARYTMMSSSYPSGSTLTSENMTFDELVNLGPVEIMTKKEKYAWMDKMADLKYNKPELELSPWNSSTNTVTNNMQAVTSDPVTDIDTLLTRSEPSLQEGLAIESGNALPVTLTETSGSAVSTGEGLLGSVLETAGTTLDIANPILLTDAYLRAGPVYDSADGKWKSWQQWQVDHWASWYRTYDPDFERNLHRILNDPKKRAIFLARLHRKPGPR